MAAAIHRRHWLGLVLVTSLLIVSSCSTCYSPKYVLRVVRHRGADFNDIEKFPASRIAASESPSTLIVRESPEVIDTLEEHPGVDDLDEFLQSTETSAFLVMHDGALVLERYPGEYGQESFQNTFSVSKSVMSALVGLAHRDGLVDPSTKITEYLPELAERDERFRAIAVEDLLRMRSGIAYSRDRSFPFINADDALIYYHPDLASVALTHTQVESAPGEFEYNNYNPPLIGLILRRATNRSVSLYAERALWQPLGAQGDAGWIVDDHGLERMESGFHARGRDLARFGQLYLEEGRALGKTLIPAAWVRATTELDEPLELASYDGRTWVYGAGWWIVPRERGRSDYCAIGAKGQFIYVSPQYAVVFVRVGPGRGDWSDFDWTEWFFATAERL